MFKVRILSKCQHCAGKAYLPIEECEDSNGKTYIRYAPCPTCEGSGNQPQWINLEDFAKLLNLGGCHHEHTSFQGNMRFIEGDVWDDLAEVCDDCGANLDKP